MNPLLPIFLSSLLLLILHHLRTPRGRLTAYPILGMLPGLVANFHRLHDFATENLRITGCTSLILGPSFSHMKILVTCDPANVNHIFNSNFHNFPKGPQFNQIFDILGDGIFNADHNSWTLQRKKAQLLISQPHFRNFVTQFSRHKAHNSLLPLLRQFTQQNKIIDLQDVFLRLSFDITSKLVFGIDPSSLSPNFTIVPFSKAIDETMTSILHRHMIPSSWWKLMRRFKLGREKKLLEAWVVIDDFIAECIKKRKMCKEDSLDESLLTAYINSKDESLCGEKFLRDTTLSLMIAGRDTIGVALAWFFYVLCKNREKEEKVVEDVRRGGEMVYLHAALCEALRLYPPVPFEAKGVVATETLPSGHRVEQGMQVLFSIYTMGRMEGVWGKDCEEFLPERWITEEGKVRHEPAYKFLSFNCGPRTCLGKAIAFAELKEIAVAILRGFRFELVEGHKVEPKLSIILQMRNGLKVRVKRRELNKFH